MIHLIRTILFFGLSFIWLNLFNLILDETLKQLFICLTLGSTVAYIMKIYEDSNQ